jgi:hypothetical protein
MNPAYYEDLAGRLHGLLITLQDRLGGQTRPLHQHVEAGEYGLALEEIAGTLARHAIAITDQERQDMLALARHMKMDDDLVPRALTRCPVPHGPSGPGKGEHLSWPEIGSSWQPPPGADSPDRGGMTQLRAYDAGLTGDPGCWVQPIKVYWSPLLDPGSPEYDPEFVAQVEWEEPGPDKDGPELEPGS